MEWEDLELVVLVRLEFGDITLRYTPHSEEIWRRLGLTLDQRDAAVEELISDGMLFHLTSEGVVLGKARPERIDEP